MFTFRPGKNSYLNQARDHEVERLTPMLDVRGTQAMPVRSCRCVESRQTNVDSTTAHTDYRTRVNGPISSRRYEDPSIPSRGASLRDRSASHKDAPRTFRHLRQYSPYGALKPRRFPASISCLTTSHSVTRNEKRSRRPRTP